MASVEHGVTYLDTLSPEGVIRIRKVGDTQDRLAITADGRVSTGDGATAPATADAVYTQAAVVAAPAALTSADAATDPPTQTEFNALRADVVALRTTLAAALVALKGTGKPMAAS